MEIDFETLIWTGIILFVVFALIVLPFLAVGWDTGVMAGTIIGYDSNMFGTKTVFVLEERTAFGDQGLSQSQITLCSDADDTYIHELIEQYINQKVIIEYKERRVGLFWFDVCHEAPITSIRLDDRHN